MKLCIIIRYQDDSTDTIFPAWNLATAEAFCAELRRQGDYAVVAPVYPDQEEDG